MKKVSFLVGVVLCCSFARVDAAPKKLALLVGVDDYLSADVRDLHGCVNDVRDMEGLLLTTYEFDPANVKRLEDGAATRKSILDAFRSHLIAKARPGDIVVFHYSGHGSRMRDVSSDEKDGWDETIVPQDSRQGGIFDISDDELNALVRDLQAKTQNITVILDSCHSGSAVRAGAEVRRAPDDLRAPPAAPVGSARAGREGSTDLRDLALDYVLIAAARSNELANESRTDEGQQRGALTHQLTRTLRAAREPMTYREVIEEVGGAVTALFPSQHPQAEGLRLNTKVFGTGEVPVAPHFVVSPSSGGVKVQGGLAYGLEQGAELDVYPPRTRDFTGHPTGQIKLTNVTAFESEGSIVAGAVQPFSRAVLRATAYTTKPVRIYYADARSGSVTAKVRERLKDVRGIQEETQLSSADLVLRRTGAASNPLAFHSPDLVALSEPVSGNGPAAVKTLIDQAHVWARWFQILRIQNRAPNATLAVSVTELGSDRADEVAAGDALKIKVKNTSRSPVYVIVLDVSNDGTSTVFYPPDKQIEDPLAAGNEIEVIADMSVPQSRRSVIDTIKVIATAEPLDPTVFELNPVRNLDELSTGRNAISSFLEEVVRGARGGAPRALTEWITSEHLITIRQEAPRLMSFVAHYEGAPASPVGGTRAALPDYDVRPFGPDQSVVEIVPGGTRGDDSSIASSAAWDEAYGIRDATGATRVEPALEFESEDFASDLEDDTRDIGDAPDNPKAEANNLWSLQHANVPAAWQLLNKDGREGEGVIIGHPDTGYRKHPEIWTADAATSPILTTAGYDYVLSRDDPFDPLDTSGPLPNPGHGTKSSSVIISPKGKQFLGDQKPERYVNGVASGARLVPLRVNRSVVQFNPSRLAKAIYDAASDDRTRMKKRADVVSISMGGVPTWNLWKAVRYAEDRGVIVVAAAGNKVGFVVWPARFSQTVGVTASNVDCGIWSGSSRGPAVDITAPGESVWHAATSRAGVDAIDLGQGTTYATATTAGIAALWLDYHRRNNSAALNGLISRGEVTSAFRNSLRAAAWRPDKDPALWPPSVSCTDTTPWNSLQLGPGIVNAAKTLQQPLTATREAAPTSLQSLPLFITIFENPEDAADRYAGIFNVPSNRIGDAAIFEGEIMQHYTMNDEVRSAIDTVVAFDRPGAVHYQAVRAALIAQPISDRLRASLQRASNPGP